jgi:AraC-like DNA-binding protein
MKTLAPCRLLRPFVKGYYILETSLSRPDIDFPASSCPHIKISSTSILFTGQTTRPSSASMVGAGAGVAFSFRPGGAFSLLGVPSNHLTDKVYPLDEMVKCPVESLMDKIRSAKSAMGRISALETFLIGIVNASHPQRVDKINIIEPIVHSNYGSLRNIARELGLSSRHFQRLVNERVGFSPRLLQRILRFEKVVDHLASARKPVCWADTACDFGFSDQSHLIREFREFSGHTPQEYLLSMSDPFNTK